MSNIKTVAVLGSTGSVGVQALDVAEQKRLCVDLIAARSNIRLLEMQIRRFHPRVCCVIEPALAKALQTAVADTSTRVVGGTEDLLRAIEDSPAEVVVNAILGEAGLLPSLHALKGGRRLALANKESLVIAGEVVNAVCRQNKSEILPVDSEHSAIFQCLQSGKSREVKRILLTASGGPFYGYTEEALRHVTKEDTLKHPTWNMGAKITVDSATMMNKGFEIMEAVHLFGISPEEVEVIVHRESIIHSAVEYIDNTVIAQLSVPDMRSCVQYAITYPDRTDAVIRPLDLFAMGTLSFARPDEKVFPLLAFARHAISVGGALPAVLNAANEEAVAAFLQEKLSFVAIAENVSRAVMHFEGSAMKEHTLEGILAFAAEARRWTHNAIFR